MKKLIFVALLLLLTLPLTMFAAEEKETPRAEPQVVAPKQKPESGRFQIVGTANGTFLLDTATGEAWLYANLIWLGTARAQLSPEMHEKSLKALFATPPGMGDKGNEPPKFKLITPGDDAPHNEQPAPQK